MSAVDKETNEEVAIKKIENTFAHKVFTIRTLREIRILRLLDHDNVIRLRTIECPNSSKFHDLYIVFDLMETDLGMFLI